MSVSGARVAKAATAVRAGQIGAIPSTLAFGHHLGEPG